MFESVNLYHAAQYAVSEACFCACLCLLQIKQKAAKLMATKCCMFTLIIHQTWLFCVWIYYCFSLWFFFRTCQMEPVRGHLNTSSARLPTKPFRHRPMGTMHWKLCIKVCISVMYLLLGNNLWAFLLASMLHRVYSGTEYATDSLPELVAWYWNG